MDPAKDGRMNAIEMSLMLRPPADEPGPDYVDAEWREIDKPLTEKSADIITPVYDDELGFDEGAVIKFWQYMQKSKTRSMIAFLFYLLEKRGYTGDEVYANCWLDVPGAHWLSNEEFRAVCRRAFHTEATRGQFSHTIFLAMDADEIWSYVVQADKECYNDLKKLPKCMKRNMYFLYEIHEGKGVPKYLRAMTELSCKPHPNNARDMVDLAVCNGHHGVNYTVPIEHISRVNGKYDRFGDDEE